MTMHECPKCGAQMEYFAADPDVGIFVSAYECPDCGHVETADDSDLEPEYDPR
jgi:ssDNA-binding Zn-finger/Zn-ribbon topoisomerase 1